MRVHPVLRLTDSSSMLTTATPLTRAIAGIFLASQCAVIVVAANTPRPAYEHPRYPGAHHNRIQCNSRAVDSRCGTQAAQLLARRNCRCCSLIACYQCTHSAAE